jgi:hypothetical protein
MRSRCFKMIFESFFINRFCHHCVLAGVLKNVIDWASRSYEGSVSPLNGKPSAAVGAGGHAGAARAHLALLPILKECGCVHMPGPELQIQRWGPGPAAFDANGTAVVLCRLSWRSSPAPLNNTPPFLCRRPCFS